MSKILMTLGLAFFSLQAQARGLAKPRDQVPQLSDDRVIFHTNMGDIVFGFYPEIAPKTVAQFLTMVKAGVYDGATFFRVDKGFVEQVSNYDVKNPPLSPEQRAIVHKIPAELSSLKHQRGVLSMARYDEDINSAESSFSILLGDAPHLDGQYTIFGEVVGGMDVVSAIENVPVKDGSTPDFDIVIDHAEVVSAAQLSSVSLQGVQPGMVPNETAKTIFEIMAGLMFFFTVCTPVVKSAFSKA